MRQILDAISVKENEECYIKTMKSDKVANVSINAKALYSTYENNSRIWSY